MMIELHKEDQEFLVDILRHTHLRGIIKNIGQTMPHPECDEYILCELEPNDVEELTGQLSFEANHNRSKRIARWADEIADSLESQLSF